MRIAILTLLMTAAVAAQTRDLPGMPPLVDPKDVYPLLRAPEAELRPSSPDEQLFESAILVSRYPYEIAGEMFTALLKEVGIYDDNAPPGRKVLGMYVFRKTFITFAGNQGIPTFGITGHKPDHMTDMQWERYRMSPQSLEQMTTDLGRIDYGLVIPRRSV